MFGWSIDFCHPGFDRYVLIVAPHTSNWDFILGIAAKWALGLKLNYLGKDSLFRSPLGWFFRTTGGIPVDRNKPGDMSREMARVFAETDRMILALAPEGTRGASSHWKTGFWHIARASGVPVVMAYIDYANRRIGGGESFRPSDDIDRDFEQIRAYYAIRRGRRPELASPVRPRDV
jgi:1-acyl-sn-glycerol-3-phosphate acyltransferase